MVKGIFSWRRWTGDGELSCYIEYCFQGRSGSNEAVINMDAIQHMGSFTYYVISRGGRGFQMLTVDYGEGGGGGWPLIT